MKLIVTGGAGFIGSAVIRQAIAEGHQVVNLDCLTYAANLDNIASVADHPNYVFEQVDICNAEGVNAVFDRHHPDAIMHLAAESHVDRSIDGPGAFIETNIIGTYVLLQAARRHFETLSGEARDAFRFHHVSTDEVYGTLGSTGLFTEETSYKPNSPYSASKASSDHLVRAWAETYQLPVVTSNCSNNYGPYQFPEKLIPVVILKCLEGQDIPIYGKGDNIRDWLYVEDHAAALLSVLQQGRLGETYNIGGHNERTNLDLVHMICDFMDELAPRDEKHRDLITFVKDRPGHDMRYAIDASKIDRELGWKPSVTIEQGMKKTVQWYLDNKDWWQQILSGGYQADRLGLAQKK